jgi:hypothetical protein
MSGANIAEISTKGQRRPCISTLQDEAGRRQRAAVDLDVDAMLSRIVTPRAEISNELLFG